MRRSPHLLSAEAVVVRRRSPRTWHPPRWFCSVPPRAGLEDETDRTTPTNTRPAKQAFLEADDGPRTRDLRLGNWRIDPKYGSTCMSFLRPDPVVSGQICRLGDIF